MTFLQYSAITTDHNGLFTEEMEMDANLKTYRAATSYFWHILIECHKFGLTLDRATNESLLPFCGEEADLARLGGDSEDEYPHAEHRDICTERIVFRKKQAILSISVLHLAKGPELAVECTITDEGEDPEIYLPLLLTFSDGCWHADSVYQTEEVLTHHEQTMHLARELKHFETHRTSEDEASLELTETQAFAIIRAFIECFKGAT